MIISKHAKFRWRQRFPGLDIMQKLKEATQQISEAELQWLKTRSTSEQHKNNLTSRGGYAFFKKTADGIIFVISQHGIVVTAFRQNPAVVYRLKKRATGRKN